MTEVSSIRTEYATVVEACGLVDRSEAGKLALSGPDAKGFLQGQVTNDVEALTSGRGCYAAFLTPKGKMLGDLRILDTGDELLLDTQRSSLQELFNMIRHFSIGYELELHKRTLECGLLSVVGPASGSLAGAEDLPEQEYAHALAEIGGVPVRAIRTDLGVDLLCGAGETDAVAEILRGRGAATVAEAVVECLRVEHGRPRYGIDLDDTVIPQEAGLNARAVSFTKGCYVGQETVARLYYRGKPNRHLRGLLLASPASTGDEITFEGRPVGRLGSVADSPKLGPIGLALVRREAPVSSSVSVGPHGIDAQVVELPFRR